MSFIINILSTPAILVGLISLFGLILQKKPVEDVVKGTVKELPKREAIDVPVDEMLIVELYSK